MSNYVLAAVDGTLSYRIEAQTFVRRFKNRFGREGDVRRYFHGPDVIAGEQGAIEGRVYEYLRDKARQTPGARLCMVGWSRGANICTRVANRLYLDGFRVYWLGMFDAVDMRVDRGKEVRKLMVKHAVHLSRENLDDVTYGRDNVLMNLVAYQPGPFTRSNVRAYFSHMTHGAMGGCDDGAESGAVWTSMVTEARKWEVPVG